MKRPVALVPSIVCAVVLGGAAAAPAACDPDGNVQFLCGAVSPEDLVAVPQSPWVVVSSMEDEGHIYLADTRSHTAQVVFPTETSHPQHDTATYSGCPGPPGTRFRPHGISLRAGSVGMHTLFVVGHGEREAVEVFRLDASGASPTLTWTGCVVAPDGVGLNSVAALPDGGFAATNFQMSGGGELWEWHPTAGWAKVPGSETAGANGLVVSADGRWFYIGGWVTESVIRLSRGQTPVQRDAVNVGFQVDNVHWAPDGSLLAAGQGGTGEATVVGCLRAGQCAGMTSQVMQVDPQTLATKEIVRYPSNDLLILATAAIQVGDEIWVGGIGGGDRIARFPAPAR